MSYRSRGYRSYDLRPAHYRHVPSRFVLRSFVIGFVLYEDRCGRGTKTTGTFLLAVAQPDFGATGDGAAYVECCRREAVVRPAHSLSMLPRPNLARLLTMTHSPAKFGATADDRVCIVCAVHRCPRQRTLIGRLALVKRCT